MADQRWQGPTSISAARGAPSPGAFSPDAGRSGVPTRAPLVVEIDRLGTGVVLINIRGAIDASTAPQLRRHLLGVTAPFQEFTRLLLDLSGVSYLDQRGLDALLQLQDRWGVGHGSVELLAPSPSVVRLLLETDLDGESQIHPGQRDADCGNSPP